MCRRGADFRGGSAVHWIRAQAAADRRFALDAANVEMWTRLDGLPLALEFACRTRPAARRAHAGDVAGRATRPLTAGSRGAPARQQTLRAALEWSHGLASPSSRSCSAASACLQGAARCELVQQVVADDAIDAWAAVRGAGGTGRSVASERKPDEPPRLLDSPAHCVREGVACSSRRLRTRSPTATPAPCGRCTSPWRNSLDPQRRAHRTVLRRNGCRPRQRPAGTLQWAQTHDEQTAASLTMAIGASRVALTGSGMAVPAAPDSG